MSEQQDQRSAAAPMTGILADGGTDMLRATVYTAPIPSRPPADLGGLVQPVFDDDAHLRDWRLDPARAERTVETADFRRYRTWRSGFSDERFLGERALIRAFLDWAQGRCDTSALGVLRLPNAHVDFHKALLMRMQIEQARRVVTAGGDIGFGLFTAPGPRKAARALIPTDPPTTVLATREAVLTVGPDGLNLQPSGAEDRTVQVRGWRSVGDGVLADTHDGDIDLGETAAARLLRIAGRHAPEVEVHPGPLATLLAPLLIFLRDAAQIAGDTGSGLYLRSGWT